MPGQPDWQRYQSSAAPTLINQVYTSNFTTPFLYVGPWRALYINGQDPTSTVDWLMNIAWADSPDGVASVIDNTVVFGDGNTGEFWIPVKSQWVSFGASPVMTAGTPGLNLTVIPTLIESAIGVRASTMPYLTVNEQLINPFSLFDFPMQNVRNGPAILTYQADVPRMLFQLWRWGGPGTYNLFNTYFCDQARHSFSHQLDLDAAPYKLRVVNNAQWSLGTFSVTLGPA